MERRDHFRNCRIFDGRQAREVRVALLEADVNFRVENGGVILLHDVNPGSVPLALDKLLRGPWLAARRLRRENACEVLPLGRLPWGGTTSLALLAQCGGREGPCASFT